VRNRSAAAAPRTGEAQSNLAFLITGIFAGPFPGGPLGMVADPLGDVRLCRHHALIERAIPGELKIFVLAISGIGDGADCQDDFNHSEGLYRKAKLENVTPNRRWRLEFRMKFAVFCGRMVTATRWW
jgi:hypothetical protein